MSPTRLVLTVFLLYDKYVRDNVLSAGQCVRDNVPQGGYYRGITLNMATYRKHQ